MVACREVSGTVGEAGSPVFDEELLFESNAEVLVAFGDIAEDPWRTELELLDAVRTEGPEVLGLLLWEALVEKLDVEGESELLAKRAVKAAIRALPLDVETAESDVDVLRLKEVCSETENHKNHTNYETEKKS